MRAIPAVLINLFRFGVRLPPDQDACPESNEQFLFQPFNFFTNICSLPQLRSSQIGYGIH